MCEFFILFSFYSICCFYLIKNVFFIFVLVIFIFCNFYKKNYTYIFQYFIPLYNLFISVLMLVILVLNL